MQRETPGKATRRDFLVRSIQLGLTAATVSSFLPRIALAQGRQGKKKKGLEPGTLVVVFLRGGCDALNVVIPYKDPYYYQHRPSIGILPAPEGQEPGVIELDKRFGLHPSLDGLFPLWEQKRFAPILNVGSPHGSRSHFDCQDFMEYAAPGDRTVKQGWLNRFQERTKEQVEEDEDTFRALAMQGLLPRALRGPHPIIAIPDLPGGAARDPLDAFDELYPGGMSGMPSEEGQEKDMGAEDPVLLAGRTTIDKIRRFRELVRAPSQTNGARYPSHPFGERLRQIAKLVKSGCGLEVAAIDYPGWDHHQGEGATDGRMAQMLKVLGDGIAAFHQDLGDRMENVLVLTMSEFGRTVKENGNTGTDHGRGGIMLAVGGKVEGGRLYGGFDSLEPSKLEDKRDLPIACDFRAVYYEVLHGVFGFNAPADFFPGGYRVPKREYQGFLKKA